MHGYYLYNGHGDVVQITNSTGVVTRDYGFDAFGVERGINDADTNPWRYCGEYTDLETSSIYLRHRYYNPASGRFLTEDPIRDGTNWYMYANSNPVTFYDPTGLYIDLIDKNKSDRTAILENLQKITNHKLGIKEIKKGLTGKTYRIEILEYAGADAPWATGNQLIKSLVDNKNFIVDIISYTDKNYFTPANSKFTNPTILFDINANPVIPSFDMLTESIYLSGRPTYIGLAHELIHAFRNMEGIPVNEKIANFQYSMYDYKEGSIFNDVDEWTITEEFIVIGLGNYVNFTLTENAIRAEHGLPLRAGVLNPDEIRHLHSKK